jgi:hypothetical protein
MNTEKVTHRILKLKKFFHLLFAAIIFSFHSSAQNISDFQIFVSADTASEIKFNDQVSGWEFDEKNGFQNYDISLSDAYSMRLTAKKATAEIMHLSVTEGKRIHKFILLYREGYNGFELNHDYSDLNKLAKLINENKDSKKQDQKITDLLSDADKSFS